MFKRETEQTLNTDRPLSMLHFFSSLQKRAWFREAHPFQHDRAQADDTPLAVPQGASASGPVSWQLHQVA